MGAYTISLLSLRDSMAKAITTVGLATLLSGTFGKSVLVIDLDPQTNCTAMLIGEKKWRELNSQGDTMYTLFKDALDETHHFCMDSALQKGVSHIQAVKSLDLLPSSLDLIDIQDKIASAPQGPFFVNSPAEILQRAVRDIRDDYDYILIDCPPSMGLLTLNALRISDGYILPIIPDMVSSYSVPRLANQVKTFAEDTGAALTCIGIVATGVQARSAIHTRSLRQLGLLENEPLFGTVFYENKQWEACARCRKVRMLSEKWGEQYTAFEDFAREVMQRAEKSVKKDAKQEEPFFSKFIHPGSLLSTISKVLKFPGGA